jgi:hypothetical protein
MNWQELITNAEAEYMPWKADIIRCAKAYIEANHAVRSNPCGWMSCHGPATDPVWAEYFRLSDLYRKAASNLWMATDVEYGDDPIANASWNWRYWKVMARKCCYYQKFIWTDHMASKTMRSLHDAESKLMEVCELSELYKSPCHYIEEAFPNLKQK